MGLDNCLADHNAERCIFPISRAAFIRATDTARRRFLHEIALSLPHDLALPSLLNVAFLSLGMYPGWTCRHVYLIPACRARRAPPFTAIAHESGSRCARGHRRSSRISTTTVASTSLCQRRALCDPLRLYHYAGSSRFEDISERAGVLDQLGGINLSHADFDNDGWLDIFVHRGSWDPRSATHFCGITATAPSPTSPPAGLLGPRRTGRTPRLADYDNTL